MAAILNEILCIGCVWGKCVEPDKCVCDFGYVGANCSIPCQCNGHANCAGPDKLDKCLDCQNNTMVSYEFLKFLVLVFNKDVYRTGYKSDDVICCIYYAVTSYVIVFLLFFSLMNLPPMLIFLFQLVLFLNTLFL